MPTTLTNGARAPIATDAVDVAGDLQKLAATAGRWFVAASTAERDSDTTALTAYGGGPSATNPLWCYRTDLGVVEVNVGSGWTRAPGMHQPPETTQAALLSSLGSGVTFISAWAQIDNKTCHLHLYLGGLGLTAGVLASSKTIATLAPAYRPANSGGFILTSTGGLFTGGQVNNTGAITISYSNIAAAGGFLQAVYMVA